MELSSCSSSSHSEEACDGSHSYNGCCSEELASQTVWRFPLLSLAIQSFVGKFNERFLQEKKATTDINGVQKLDDNRETATNNKHTMKHQIAIITDDLTQ